MGISPFGCETSCNTSCDGGVIGPTGKSAYDIAVERGFVGTKDEWLESLKGRFGQDGSDGVDGVDGTAGLTAYQIALAHGFIGTEAQWLASLVGSKGSKGDKGDKGDQGIQGLPGPAGTAYRYGGFAVSNILASEVLLEHVVTVAHTLPDGLLGSHASAGTNPTNFWVASILQNGVQIGSITIDVDGTIDLGTVGGDMPIAVGDVITLVAPAVADATIARLRYTFEGIV